MAAASSLAGASNVKLFFLHSNIEQIRCARLVAPYRTRDRQLETFYGLRGTPLRLKQVSAASGDSQHWRSPNSVVVRCALSSANSESDHLEGEQSLKELAIPGSSDVESLINAISDTSSVAEFELNLAGFRLYVKRDLKEKSTALPSPNLPFVQHYPSVQTPELNGSPSATSLAISKPDPSPGSIQRADSSSDEGLAILQSPKVGFFRRSRTIKGKRGPPPCKEKQEVKEGQVLCYIEQLGGEIPIESDVSGEVIKILREDGEPVGYGDALITILPSFPGIKKLQ